MMPFCTPDDLPVVIELKLRYANLCSYLHNSTMDKLDSDRAVTELTAIRVAWRARS